MLPPIGTRGAGAGDIDDMGIGSSRNNHLDGNRQLSLGGILGAGGNSIVSSSSLQKKRQSDAMEAGAFQMNVYTPDKF